MVVLLVALRHLDVVTVIESIILFIKGGVKVGIEASTISVEGET